MGNVAGPVHHGKSTEQPRKQRIAARKEGTLDISERHLYSLGGTETGTGHQQREGRRMSAGRRKSIEDGVADIYAKADARIESGCNPIEADWQAILELYVFMAQKHLLSNRGQLVPIQIDDEGEWSFYLDVLGKLDLPPDTCALLMTPSGSKSLPVPSLPGMDKATIARWENSSYSLLISDATDNERILHAALPGSESVGIDVMEDGRHLAEYSYYTVEECLEDLSNVTWTYFGPRDQWSREEVTRYTNNWYGKFIHGLDPDHVRLHAAYSYLHHPELLTLTPMDAAFMVIEATIPREYDSLDKAVELTNDLNRDMTLGNAIVTEAGIAEGNHAECQAFFGHIALEIDMHLELVDGIEGAGTPDPRLEQGFDSVFDHTARRLYKTITGRDCPQRVTL